MKLRQKSSSSAIGTVNFELLRAKLEFEVARPALIAITSSSAEDGKEIAARGLAYSLAATGYATLLLDTCLASRGLANPPQGTTFEEIACQLISDSGAGKLSVFDLGDLLLQKTTGQRQIQSAFEILRSEFDYVVINTEYGGSTAFAASVVAAADAVLVTVKTGRRETADDARLSADLERIGSRFLGVIALDPTVITGNKTIAPVSDAIPDRRRNDTGHVDKQPQLREIAKWPT